MKIAWLFVIIFCIFSAGASLVDISRRLFSLRVFTKEKKRLQGWGEMQKDFSDRVREEKLKCIVSLAIFAFCVLGALYVWKKFVFFYFWVGS